MRILTWIAAHFPPRVAVGRIDDEELSFIVGVD